MELRLADQQRSSEVLPRGAIHLAALIPPPISPSPDLGIRAGQEIQAEAEAKSPGSSRPKAFRKA